MPVALVLSPKAENVTSRGVLTTSGGRTEAGPSGRLCSGLFGSKLGLQRPLCPAHQVTCTGCDHSEGLPASNLHGDAAEAAGGPGQVAVVGGGGGCLGSVAPRSCCWKFPVHPL